MPEMRTLGQSKEPSSLGQEVAGFLDQQKKTQEVIGLSIMRLARVLQGGGWKWAEIFRESGNY